MTTETSVSEIYLDLPLFAGLSESQLELVKRSMRVLKLQEGQSLFNTAQTADRFFVLRRGLIKLFRLAPNGSEKIIEIIRPGQSFAVAVMFMEAKSYPVNADALQESRVLSFENSVFMNILRDSPQTCFPVMAEMSRHLHRQVTEIDRLSLSSAPNRVAAYLLEKCPKTGEERSRFLLDAPKRVIASRLSMKPETLSRVLKNLHRDGLIEMDRRTIHIADLNALRAFAAGEGCAAQEP